MLVKLCFGSILYFYLVFVFVTFCCCILLVNLVCINPVVMILNFNLDLIFVFILFSSLCSSYQFFLQLSCF